MLDDDRLLHLPDTPSDQQMLAVAAWSEPVEIRTYEPGEPTRMPAFLENRVYQGSSGRVYPLPFIESVAHEPHVKPWQAVHLENEFVRLMIMPELGGRIHIAVDKTTGGDLFYRNNTIKPALVGLAGPWISGGIEFNWPQHHRAGTFLPMDWTIERDDDGSVTVWCSDHDPFERMKGMHGIRLRPGSAVIEARVRLFNRTPLTQTFLWWANVAARVHDDYQSFFPTDVHMVADHAKRAVTAFPAADRPYYGIDYAARADPERTEFVGPDADRLDWYRNIPVPTSYMCVGSADDFFGGYDHAARLGFVHVADHRIAPGKKQWTWGNAPFGWAWDDNLSDGDGPYIELMAGVYTDNQPDFSYLAPGETKTFSQFWYPFHGIGPVQQANTEVAVRLVAHDAEGGAGDRSVEVGIATTRERPALHAALFSEAGHLLWQTTAMVAPGAPLTARIDMNAPGSVELVVTDAATELVRCSTAERPPTETIEPATELPVPESIASADELYLAGVHLAQYRHATRSPEPYWEELLRRDPLDSRANVAMGERRLRAGRLDDAERHLRAAIARETRRHPNPATGDAHYLLGLVLIARGRHDEAYDALAKSMWNAAWRVPARLALARLDAASGRWPAALANAEEALRFESEHLQAMAIAVIALRRLGRAGDAERMLRRAAALDPLDLWIRDLAGEAPDAEAHHLLDLAGEYAELGLEDERLRVLDAAAAAAEVRPVPGAGNALPLVHYHRADALWRLDRSVDATRARTAARSVDADAALPGGLGDALVLEHALERDGSDARAHALLGHWWYFHHAYDEAVRHLEASAALDPSDAIVWRGLGLAAYNIGRDGEAAAAHYQRALTLAPDDPKLLVEADQLARRRGVALDDRMRRLTARPDVISRRDDLTIAYAELLTLTGDPDAAVELIGGRRFSPWEGGEGEVLRVWSLAQQAVARRAMSEGRADVAVTALCAALEPPANLGEARHPLANSSDVLLASGDALAAAGQPDAARAAWGAAASSAGDFTTMLSVPFSPMTYFSVLAARRLGDEETAQRLIEGLRRYLVVKREETPSIDYFATSLPSMLTFIDGPEIAHAALIDVLEAQLALLEGRDEDAAAVLLRRRSIDPADPLVASLLEEASTPA